jgi:hypothetical protein
MILVSPPLLMSTRESASLHHEEITATFEGTVDDIKNLNRIICLTRL